MKIKSIIAAVGVLLSPVVVQASYYHGYQVNTAVERNVAPIKLSVMGTYESGIIDDSAAEIVAYDPYYKRAYVTNASEDTIDVISVRHPSYPRKLFSIDLKPYGSPNSVAFSEGVIAVAVEAEVKQDNGSVVLFDRHGNLLNQLEVGALPDMLTFTPDGKKIVVANEGEPNDDYTVDPEGTVSIITLSSVVGDTPQTAVETASFSQFNNVVLDESLRIYGPSATVAQDLEPEYITVSADSKTAYVTLQENNGLAVVDIETAQVINVLGLGTKSYNTIQTAIDASDKDDAINIRPWPVESYYQPDAITSYTVDGETYLITANEGDARDYDGFSEEDRVDDLDLDPSILAAYPGIQDDENLGRLKTTTVNGDLDGDGDVDQIFGYGARSFSIWNSAGEIVFDSGSDFERITAETDPKVFNANDNEADKRSDDKGPEPESVAVGEINGETYAFIGLERSGGIMVYNVTSPISPYFVQYINNVKTDGDVELGTAGDVAPEGIAFVPAHQSPNRRPMLIVTNEVSGTTTTYKISVQKSHKRHYRYSRYWK